MNGLIERLEVAVKELDDELILMAKNKHRATFFNYDDIVTLKSLLMESKDKLMLNKEQ